jgi:D-3-phosphoglycerate dehydrogenase
MSRPVVLLYEPIHDDAIRLLREKCEVRFAASLDEDALIENVSEVDAIIIRANGKVSRKLMKPHCGG